MAALAEHRGQQEGRQRHSRHETQHRWALRRVRAGPALDVRALPQDEIRGHARIAVRKGVSRRHVRRLHARAQGKGGRRAQGPRCVRKLRHGGAEQAARRKAAFAAMAARATGPSVAHAWKHWRHFVHIRRHAPHLVSALAEHECAVVAWKAWKFLAFGRPVARDPEVVVAWKHWKHWALAEVATRNARADALARRLAAARQAELRRIDDKKVREVRRANAAADRRRRADEDWGFTDADEYAVRRRERARREARRQKEAQLRRRDLFGPDGDQIEDGDGEMEEKADEDTKPMDFATFSHTVVCWRRWRRFVKGVRSGEFTNDDAADQARAEAEAQARMEEVRLAAMRRVGVDAPEIRNLADLAMRRQPGDSDDDSQRADSEDEDENESEKGPTEEEERAALEAIRSAKREAAALKIQKIAKGFIQRRRYQRMKKDPFYRVRGLKALIARGEKIFERDAERVARAKSSGSSPNEDSRVCAWPPRMPCRA